MKAIVVLCFIGFLGFVSWGFILGIESMEASRCHRKWSQSGFDDKFVSTVGCMVQIDGRWLPEGNVVVHPQS